MDAIQPLDFLYSGVGSLAEQLDKYIVAQLQDGKCLIGRLLSYDNYGTLLLEDTRERAIVGNTYFDSPMPGIYIVRGENLTLIGELDETLDAENPNLKPAASAEDFAALKEAADAASAVRRAKIEASGLAGKRAMASVTGNVASSTSSSAESTSSP